MSKLVLEKSNELPNGWGRVRIGDIFEFNYGKSLSNENRVNGRFPVYGSSGIIGYHSQSLTNDRCLVIGRKGSAGEVYRSYTKCWPIDTTYYVHIPNELDFDFIYYAFINKKGDFVDNSTTIPSLVRDRAYEVTLPLAPLNEQKRIVAKIEELFSKLDFFSESVSKIKQQLKQYQQSVLKSAFEGKLTEVWRNEHITRLESASDILKRILTPKKIQKSLEITDLPNLPKNWIWTNVSMIENFIGSGITPLGGKSVYVEKGIPFIRSQNVFLEGLKLDGIAHVTEEMHEQMARTHLKDMDVLLNITGASIGRCTYVPNGFGYGNVNQHVCIIRTSSDIFSPYLSYWLNSPLAQIMIFGAQKGETREGLNYSQIRSLLFPLCSLIEQNIIVQQLEKSLTVISNTNKEMDRRLYDIRLLRQSILKDAFRGKLVSQVPNDEPVEILLQRIKQEKKNQKIIKSTSIKPRRIKNAK